MIIFIDESGTLPDVSDKYIVLAALVAPNTLGLEKILPKFRKKTPSKGSRKQERRVREFKFHYVGDITRMKVLREIISKDVRIYILAVDKMGRKIKDTPENYGKLVKNLTATLIKREKPRGVYIDKHFGNKSDSEKLQLILDTTNDQIEFKQVDSVADPRIDLADFIAGAVLKKFRTEDKTFYNIISSKIIWKRTKKWNEL
ncbi:DUF3800 domain-containing protein [Candidatus Daviesbacteria bacterium]|nr:DUF3800 domain-containing protein [Candidatus Daviesbacteria bacterium]